MAIMDGKFMVHLGTSLRRVPLGQVCLVVVFGRSRVVGPVHYNCRAVGSAPGDYSIHTCVRVERI
jgi:hypothetical protein